MYISHSIGIILILLPLLFIAAIVAIGVVLYRHPSKLQKKWYQVSLKRRKRVKQAAVVLGFCILIVLFVMPLVQGERFVSMIRLSAKEDKLITSKQILAKANETEPDVREGKGKWLKTIYKILNSDSIISSSINISETGVDNYEVWKDNIANDKTGEYEVRLDAKDVVIDNYAEDMFSYDEDGFYNIIKKSDKTYEENYQKLSDADKKQIEDLNWNYKKGILYATDKKNRGWINGTAQYYMKDSKLINTMEKSGFAGIKKWMKQCEDQKEGINVKVGNKTYLFHNTNKWYKFEKNGLTCLYNYRCFVIRFDLNKVIGMKSHIADLPQTGRELWSVMADHSGKSCDEVVLRSYNKEDPYAKKNVQILLKDHKIKQVMIYWEESESLKGFTKEEKVFLKACFEKMGISSEDAAKWLETFTIKKKGQNGKLGSWTYQQGKISNQIIALTNTSDDADYVNFYKNDKGNNK